MLKLRKPSQHRPRRSSSVTARSLVSYPSLDDLYEEGKSLRKKCPRKSHAVWKPPHDRPDPVRLLQESNKGRIPQLIPIRHGRMMQTPFAFYRGAALNMAADLGSTPATGLQVQACGDAHLLNFGVFATPERREIFDVNDLDETLPAPWEWDIKRLAASFLIACRDNGISERSGKDVVETCVRSYRESMAEFSQIRTLELWYESMGADELVANIKDPNFRQRALKRLQKEKTRHASDDIFPKLVEHKEELPIIKDQLPTIFHARGHSPGQIQKVVMDTIAGYRETLPHSVQSLLDRYQLRDAAIKVVCVGSVGTRCWVLLFMAGEGDPLFLQVKEARPSVLASYAGKTVFRNEGQRIVNGYRLMQPATDIFLGWTVGTLAGHHYFVRQLRDIKISVRVETFGAAEMDLYATWCGRALALAHARSGRSSTL